MQKLYGVWIDHSRALIVKCNEDDVISVTEMMSEVEPNRHEGKSFERLTLTNQKVHGERRHNEIKAFSRQVLEAVKDADELAIFGPADGKKDLKKEIDEHKVLKGKLTAMETADKMTENQLKAFVRKLFNLPRIPA
ncbi:MAG: hypothetical protein WC882_01160 [Candidatus Gracilibacteria bacterium]|jgi:hypothetical protein